MKKNLFFIGLLALAFAGCQPKQVEIRTEEMSHKTEDYQVAVEYATFSSSDAELNQACQVLNGTINKSIKGIVDEFKKQSTAMFEDLAAKGMERPSWGCELVVKDSVFMATDRYISVRFTIYSFTGGAHGITKYLAFNYDVAGKRMLEQKDIIDARKAGIVNAQLEANFSNPQGCFTDKPTLEKTTVLNLTSTALCFTFEQNVLGAYACGTAEISVSRQALKDALLLL